MDCLSNVKHCEPNRIFLGLFDSTVDYDNDKSKTGFFTQTLVNGPTANIVYEGLPSGWYAIKVYHDVNDNKTLDKNFMGFPKEQYGFSNNASGFLGSPSYKDASFNLVDDLNIKISLK